MKHIFEAYASLPSIATSEYINFLYQLDKQEEELTHPNYEIKTPCTTQEFMQDKDIDLCDDHFHLIKDGWIFDILLTRHQEKKLFVLFGGARTLTQKNLYSFSRWSYFPFMAGNVLSIVDPMFYKFPNLELGWYYGTQDINIYSYMYKLIYIIKRKYNFNNLIFYGSSGGGYAALQCATYFKNSLAIAINPQIYINKFGYSKEFYKITNIDLDKKDKYERNLLVDRILKSNSKFFIIQNETDKDHCSNHLFPFMKKFNIALKYGLQAKNNIYIWIYHAFGGHNAQENKEILQFIIYISNFIIENKKITSYEETLCIAFSELWAQFFWLKYCCTDRH